MVIMYYPERKEIEKIRGNTKVREKVFNYPLLVLLPLFQFEPP